MICIDSHDQVSGYSIDSRTEKVSSLPGSSIEDDSTGTSIEDVSTGTIAEAGATSLGADRVSPVGTGLVGALLTGIADAESIVDAVEASGIVAAGEIEPIATWAFGGLMTDTPTGATLFCGRTGTAIGG